MSISLVTSPRLNASPDFHPRHGPWCTLDSWVTLRVGSFLCFETGGRRRLAVGSGQGFKIRDRSRGHLTSGPSLLKEETVIGSGSTEFALE